MNYLSPKKRFYLIVLTVDLLIFIFRAEKKKILSKSHQLQLEIAELKIMASIKINELHFAGADLFNDSESFLSDLEDRELVAAIGGITPIITITAAWGTVSVWGVSFGTGFALGTFGAGAVAGYFASR